MTIAFANLGASANPDIASTANATSYDNTSWTPPTSGLIVVFVSNRGNTDPENVARPAFSMPLEWASLAGSLRRLFSLRRARVLARHHLSLWQVRDMQIIARCLVAAKVRT